MGWFVLTNKDAKFPDPLVMQRELREKGRRMVTIIDPHIKKDDAYRVSLDGDAFYVKDSNGNNFEGWCWPGTSRWIDFTSPAARDFWATQFAYDKYTGSSESLYVWNDMNEPSVFSGLLFLIQGLKLRCPKTVSILAMSSIAMYIMHMECLCMVQHTKGYYADQTTPTVLLYCRVPFLQVLSSTVPYGQATIPLRGTI